MPKMKTKSSAKKRFKILSSGKIGFFKAFRRHGLRKRSQKMKRQSRGGHIMFPSDAAVVSKHYLPNG
mgnify:CR=1 FL=1